MTSVGGEAVVWRLKCEMYINFKQMLRYIVLYDYILGIHSSDFFDVPIKYSLKIFVGHQRLATLTLKIRSRSSYSLTS